MDFFEKHKALIITILLMSVLLLGMYNVHVSSSNEKVRETLIELNQAPPPETEAEEETAPPQERENPHRKFNFETHQAYNQDQEESRRNFESRLDEIFEKNSAEQTASEEEASSAGDYRLQSNQNKERREASEGEGTSPETSTRRGTLRNSSISFSLLGRTALDIPNPIYTCDAPGKIVVNIVVNESGEVTDTSINESSSTSSNECLEEQAMKYARRAVFSRLSGKDSQPGTITYNFQG